MTLTQLAYFLAAVRYGSLSAAADALHVAQPSLSSQVAKLERELGLPLFTRGNRGLTLTAAGRQLRPHAERVMGAVEDAEVAVSAVRTLAGGSVDFGTFSSAHHYLLADLISDFRAAYPQVTLRVVSGNSAKVADFVRHGELEAGLVAIPVDDRGLEISESVWTCEAAYFHADPGRVTDPVTIDTICATPLILPEAQWGDQDPTRRQLTLAAQRSGRSLRPSIEVESPAMALDIASRGLGGTVSALPLARVLGYTEQMSWAPLKPRLTETFAFVWRQDARLSPATQALIALAKKHLRRMHRERVDRSRPST